jgi:hypothetical protein
LVDFFSEQSVTPGQARQGYMGAKHFCNDYVPWSEGRPDGELYGSLNEQISHLTYNRSSADNEKIGRKERLELLRQIERELEIFAARLKPIYKERWPFGKVQRPREGVNALPRYNVTSQVQTIGLRASLHDAYGYAGSGPSSLPPDAPEKSEKKGSE